jgi:hypothetical protein
MMNNSYYNSYSTNRGFNIGNNFSEANSLVAKFAFLLIFMLGNNGNLNVKIFHAPTSFSFHFLTINFLNQILGGE